MQEWEYKTVELKNVDLLTQLNANGREGWELCAVVPAQNPVTGTMVYNKLAIFKRPFDPKKTFDTTR